MARRKPTKTLRPKPVERKVRIHTTPKLTRSEFEKLEARAAVPPGGSGGWENAVPSASISYLRVGTP